MCRRGGLFFIAWLLALWVHWSAAAVEPRPAVINVRAASHDSVTRFVLDLSGSAQFKVVPESSDRIIVSFPDIDWQSATTHFHRPVGIIHDFRLDRASDGTLRLIFNTEGPAVVLKAFLLPPLEGAGHRFVIDIAGGQALPKTPPQMAASLGAPPVPPVPDPPPRAEGGGRLASARVMLAVPVPKPKPRPSKPLVMLDPGHGGADPGAISPSGAFEKTIVLALAREIRAELAKRGLVECRLTRDSDVFIPLRERVAIARTAHADLFMSIHADSVADPSLEGLKVYTLSQNASDAEAQALADKENKSDIVAGIDLTGETPEVTNILIDLVQRESMNLSVNLANDIVVEVAHTTHQPHQNTHRFAGFAVLKAPDIPSVLIEAGYLSNRTDEQMLLHHEQRAKLAGAMARAIEQYFAQIHKPRRR